MATRDFFKLVLNPIKYDDIIDAVIAGDINGVQGFLDADIGINAYSDETLLEKFKKYQGTPLTAAARSGQTEMVKFLLEKGADPNIADPYLKNTPLHYAALYGKKDILGLLLSHDNVGISLTAKNSSNHTPLETVIHQYDVLLSMPTEKKEPNKLERYEACLKVLFDAQKHYSGEIIVLDGYSYQDSSQLILSLQSIIVPGNLNSKLLFEQPPHINPDRMADKLQWELYQYQKELMLSEENARRAFEQVKAGRQEERVSSTGLQYWQEQLAAVEAQMDPFLQLAHLEMQNEWRLQVAREKANQEGAPSSTPHRP